MRDISGLVGDQSAPCSRALHRRPGCRRPAAGALPAATCCRRGAPLLAQPEPSIPTRATPPHAAALLLVTLLATAAAATGRSLAAGAACRAAADAAAAAARWPRFLVVGDWGRRGRYNQSAVAAAMARKAAALPADFVVSTGEG